ncbi:hypothetical protein PC128_g729 [Phytophthora cactorum]|nr:hypothetical protein PC128_g729 [Phytophthora cactorum]
MKYKKYYKGLFLGLVDLAIINAYIVYNAARVATNKPKMSHVKFLKRLHLELCHLREEGWESLRSDDSFQATPSKTSKRARSRRSAHTATKR